LFLSFEEFLDNEDALKTATTMADKDLYFIQMAGMDHSTMGTATTTDDKKKVSVLAATCHTLSKIDRVTRKIRSNCRSKRRLGPK